MTEVAHLGDRSSIPAAWIPVISALLIASGCADASDEATGADAAGADPDGVDLAAGEQTYMDFCGSCHGRDFEGSSQGPSQLDPHFAPEITGDDDYRRAITEGAPREYFDFTAMPAIGSLDDDEIDDVIAYIRSIQEERGFQD
jgi:mono/diheme cytochrome c family protein